MLLDKHASNDVCATIRNVVEADGDARVSDLHVWSIGPSLYAAIVSIVADAPNAVDYCKQLIARNHGLVHVTIEVHHCAHGPV
jgi:Co/Zn/Cd efflux system component